MKGGVFAAIDVGTTKVCTVVGEAVPEQPLRILGVGIAAANGLNRGMVENLRDASESIRASVEQAERSSGTRILSAHVGVAGPHISSQNNRGIVAIPDREESVGRWEGTSFDPEGWKNDYPNPAFVRMTPRDAFWAAKLVE